MPSWESRLRRNSIQQWLLKLDPSSRPRHRQKEKSPSLWQLCAKSSSYTKNKWGKKLIQASCLAWRGEMFWLDTLHAHDRPRRGWSHWRPPEAVFSLLMWWQEDTPRREASLKTTAPRFSLSSDPTFPSLHDFCESHYINTINTSGDTLRRGISKKKLWNGANHL